MAAKPPAARAAISAASVARQPLLIENAAPRDGATSPEATDVLLQFFRGRHRKQQENDPRLFLNHATMVFGRM